MDIEKVVQDVENIQKDIEGINKYGYINRKSIL